MAKDKMIGADDLLAKAMRRVLTEEAQERIIKDQEIEVAGALLRRPQSAEKKKCPARSHHAL